jgi:hypothetical protein
MSVLEQEAAIILRVYDPDLTDDKLMQAVQKCVKALTETPTLFPNPQPLGNIIR